jgi:putative DNA-invertase from lambdoid prophage Rac
VQCDVRDAFVALKEATAQAQAEDTKEAQRAGIAHATANGGPRAYKGRTAKLQPQAARERAGDARQIRKRWRSQARSKKKGHEQPPPLKQFAESL